MLFLVADENFNNTIYRGLLRIKPDLDIVRVQDVGLFSADDPAVLEWAAKEDRVLLTHDVATITKYALPKGGNREIYARSNRGQPQSSHRNCHRGNSFHRRVV